MNTRAALALLVIPGLLAPVPAAAQPSATLGATSTRFAWEGGPGRGAGPDRATAATLYWLGGIEYDPPCGELNDCERILLNVTAQGHLSVAIAEADPVLSDLDLYLYASDAGGRHVSKPLAVDAGYGNPERVTLTHAQAGYYLVEVFFWQAVDATYTGVAEFRPEPPEVAPAPEPPAAATPTAPARLPKVARCARPAPITVTVRAPRRAKLHSVRMTANGRRLATRRAGRARVATLDLRRFRGRRVRVRIVINSSAGRRVRWRVYLPCRNGSTEPASSGRP